MTLRFPSMRLPAIAALLLLPIGLAGCQTAPSRPVSAPVAPMKTPLPAPAPISADWRDRAVTAGSWHYTPGTPLSFARYGTSGGADFTMRCDATLRQVALMRSGSASEIVITTTSRTARFPAGAASDQGRAMSAVILNASDNFLDAMAFSRGRILIASSGLPDIIVPAWAEITRAVEDCRK